MSESASVEQFIRDRQAAVLARARASLESAPEDAMPSELHRLIGTLGTYQLETQSQALRGIHDALVDGALGPGAAREGALEALAASTPSTVMDSPC